MKHLMQLAPATAAHTNTLRSLLTQLQSETLVSPDPNVYQTPTYDEAAGIWTLKQTTANADGEYMGEYHLPALDVCSAINTLTPVSYSPPAPPNPPRACCRPAQTRLQVG